MDSVSHLRRSDQIIGISAILFFIFLFFFKWLGFSSNATSVDGINVGGSFSYNGWHSFTTSRWIWLITIIAALVSVAISAGWLKIESPVHPGAIVAGLGALSVLLILYRIIHHPSASASVGNFHTSFGIKIGIWLGLLAAAGVTYGGYMKMQDDGTSISDVRDQASGAISGLSASSGDGAAATAPPAAPAPAPTPAPATPAPAAAPPPAGEAAPPIPPPSAAPGETTPPQ